MVKKLALFTGILILFMFIGSISPVVAAEEHMDKQTFDSDNDFQATDETFSHFSHEGYDERHHCPFQVPPSYTSIENLTIACTLMNATPHWMFLAAGKTEQNALLSYIRQANISTQKKHAWTLFMMKTWMKYPVKYIKLDNGAKLVPGTSGRFWLTFRRTRHSGRLKIILRRICPTSRPER